MTREKALRELLAEIFRDTELRQFVGEGTNGTELCKTLPSDKVSLNDLVNETVEALDRHGLINPEFFKRLAEYRPHQANAIRAVQELWPKRLVEIETSGVGLRRRLIGASAIALLAVGGTLVYQLSGGGDPMTLDGAPAENVPPKKGATRDQRPVDAELASKAPPADQTKQSEWHCLCYRYQNNRSVEPITGCRQTAGDCLALYSKIDAGDSNMFPGSLTHSCRPLGPAEHPGDRLMGRKGWEPSKRPDSFFHKGACLLTERGAEYSLKKDFIKHESLAGLVPGKHGKDQVETIFGTPDGGPAEPRVHGEDVWDYREQCLRVRFPVSFSFIFAATAIEVTGPSSCKARTAKGIGMSATWGEVMAAYPGALKQVGSMLAYEGDGMRLEFSFDGAAKVDRIAFETLPDSNKGSPP